MLLVSVIVVPFLFGVLCFMLRGSPATVRQISLIGTVCLLAVVSAIAAQVWREGTVAAQLGGWPAPFGITFAVDAFGAAMLVATALVGFFAVLFGMAEVDERSERLGHHTLMHLMLGGVSGAFATGDIFNLYVWFEVLLLSSFGLMVLKGGRRQIDASMRYVGLNLVATTGFLLGVGLLYGSTGALNMADLSVKANGMSEATRFATGALLLFAFAAKAAMFPLFFWLPASYHAPSFTVSAVFAALLTKVGVYAIFRVGTLIYGLDTPGFATLLLWGGVLTMFAGVLGALAQAELRRVLAFQTIASIGFMAIGLGIGTEAAVTAGVFYLLQDMIVKANLFTAAWVGARAAGSEDLPEAGGVWALSPLVAALFLMPALSLAGVPPFSGFWAKVLILDATLSVGAWWLAAAALLTGLLTLLAMGRVFAEVYWKDRPLETPSLAAEHPHTTPLPALLSCAGLTAITLVVGVYPEPFIGLARAAAAGLLDPTAYVTTVLGGAP